MHPDNDEELFAPQSPADTPSDHRHDYAMYATDMTIVRWCPSCGMTWTAVRYVHGGHFEDKWTPVREPHQPQERSPWVY